MPSKSEMILDADASQLVAETKRAADATTDLEKAVKSVVETSIKGHKDVIEHLQKEGAAVKSLLVDNENLKAKIKELTEKHETFVQSVEKGAKGMSDIAKGLSGAAIFQLIGNLIDEQNRWNKEIVNTQVEYDKLAIKARTALMMSSKDFEKVYAESIFPTTQKYKVSQETATSAYAAASFVPEKDRAGVLQRSVEGAKAAGVDDQNVVEYEKAIFARLNQEGKAITADAVHKASLSMANIGGATLKMSGDEILHAQQTFGKVEGMDQDQMWSEFATLKKKGGMDSGKAAQQMSMIATSLHALSDPAKKMMGDELTAGVEGEMSKGNIMGAISMIKQAMDQQNLSEQEEDIYQELRIAMLKAASYYKRQTWVEACLESLPDSPAKQRLTDRWDGRAHHKRGASFGECEEQELKRLVEQTSERPSPHTPLVIDATCRTYIKSIIWNHKKHLGKRISRETPLRAGCVSLSEHQFLSGAP
jgi:hypothetical protein